MFAIILRTNTIELMDFYYFTDSKSLISYRINDVLL